MVVDLPAPFGPRNPNTSPVSMPKSTSTIPRRTPNFRVRCSTRTIGAPLAVTLE